MGYPTKAHREAIRQFGATPLHRMTFTLLNKQISLDLK
jgi:ribonuclease HII